MVELLDQLELLDPESSAEAKQRVDTLVRRCRLAAGAVGARLTVPDRSRRAGFLGAVPALCDVVHPVRRTPPHHPAESPRAAAAAGSNSNARTRTTEAASAAAAAAARGLRAMSTIAWRRARPIPVACSPSPPTGTCKFSASSRRAATRWCTRRSGWTSERHAPATRICQSAGRHHGHVPLPRPAPASVAVRACPNRGVCRRRHLRRGPPAQSLDSVMGRMLEVREVLVQKNRGVTFINLDEVRPSAETRGLRTRTVPAPHPPTPFLASFPLTPSLRHTRQHRFWRHFRLRRPCATPARPCLVPGARRPEAEPGGARGARAEVFRRVAGAAEPPAQCAAAHTRADCRAVRPHRLTRRRATHPETCHPP